MEIVFSDVMHFKQERHLETGQAYKQKCSAD